MQQLKETGRQEFSLVIKGDVQGSVEAIVGALRKLGTEEVEARILAHAGVGGITRGAGYRPCRRQPRPVVVSASTSAPMCRPKASADQAGVEIRYYNIIYDLVDDVTAAMSGLLSPLPCASSSSATPEILEVFNISKVGKVAGCRVTEGKVERGAKVRLIRDNVVVHEGTLSTLKRFKDEVRRCRPGRSAAWPSPTTRTSARAT